MLAKLATGEAGRVVARCRAQCAEGAGVSLPTWKRWVGVLVGAGLLERVEASRWELGLRVTEAGLRAASSGSLCGSVSREVSREVSRGETGVSHPFSSSFSLSSEALKNKREEVLGGSPRGSVSRGEPGGEPRAAAHVSREVSRGGEPGVRLVIEAPDAAGLVAALRSLLGAAPHESSIPLNVRAPEPVASTAAVTVASASIPPAAQPAPALSHEALGRANLAWTQFQHSWVHEFGLPHRKAAGPRDSQAFIEAVATPGGPSLDVLKRCLVDYARRWKGQASENKAKGMADEWGPIPSVRTWLANKPWGLMADPVALAPGEKPKLSGEALSMIGELRSKAEGADRRGDGGLAEDYRRRIDRIKATGVVA